MLKLRFSNTAQKQLRAIKKTRPALLELILNKINHLSINPLANGVLKLKSYDNVYRAKAKNYRIIYQFDNEFLFIVMIETRARVYEAVKRIFK